MRKVTREVGSSLILVDTGAGASQQFVARHDQLTALSLWTATHDARSEFRLLEGTGDQVLRRVPLPPQGIASSSWQRIPFEPVPDSRGRSFRFELEGGSRQRAAELWTNLGANEPFAGQPAPNEIGPRCYRTHYRHDTHALLDPLLSRYVRYYPDISVTNGEKIRELLRYGVCRERSTLFQLLHLLDAFNRTQGVRRVLSLGSGAGICETFLAARFPELEIHAAGFWPKQNEWTLANLRRLDDDSPATPSETAYDFVFAIEQRDGAADAGSAIRRPVNHVRPGGWLYLAAPIASSQAKREKLELDSPPGSAPLGLESVVLDELFLSNQCDVLFAASLLDNRLTQPLDGLLRVIGADSADDELETLLRLFLLDVKSSSRSGLLRRPAGVKYLGRRSGGRQR